MQILMSSRRTVMSGEVVTFSTAFEPWGSAFGKAYKAAGPFEVSASRDAVMVHRAECRTAEQSAALVEAIQCAEAVRATLAPYQRGGHPSMFPEEPTPTDKPPNVRAEPQHSQKVGALTPAEDDEAQAMNGLAPAQ